MVDNEEEPIVEKPTEAGAKETTQQQGQVVTPWDVEGADEGIDYDKIVRDFGSKLISKELLERFERVTQMTAHPLLRRGVYFAHRDLERILDIYEKGKPFFIYTGRGPSSTSLHLGHMVQFMFTAYLQKAFNAIVCIQLTDDEKFLWKDLKLEECRRMARENAKDIIACGFEMDKTFILSDFDYIQYLYPNMCRIAKKITASTAAAVFGFEMSYPIGKWGFPPVQAATAFSNSYPHIFGTNSKIPCLIPCAIDQDPYFRITRDVAPKLGYPKPCLILSKFIPALQGMKTKMSASVQDTSIYMTDTPNQIKKKINRHAFSGGKDTAEEQREFGANVDVDVSCQYLSFFLDDDVELKRTVDDYAAGKYLTGEVKAILIKLLQEIVKKHQEDRAKVTEEILTEFMTPRKLDIPRPKTQPPPAPAKEEEAKVEHDG